MGNNALNEGRHFCCDCSKVVFCRYFKARVWPVFKFLTKDLQDCNALVEKVGRDALNINHDGLLKDCKPNIYRMLRGLQRKAKNATIATYRAALKKGLFFAISFLLHMETNHAK